jgi:hypothetical protein
MLQKSQHSKLIRLKLNSEQGAQFAPLAIEASSARQNVLFIASVVPFWSPQKSETVWELQVAKVPAVIGHKIARLIRDSLKEPSA